MIGINGAGCAACLPAFPLVDACLSSGLSSNINCRKWEYCEAWLVPPLIDNFRQGIGPDHAVEILFKCLPVLD